MSDSGEATTAVSSSAPHRQQLSTRSLQQDTTTPRGGGTSTLARSRQVLASTLLAVAANLAGPPRHSASGNVQQEVDRIGEAISAVNEAISRVR